MTLQKVKAAASSVSKMLGGVVAAVPVLAAQGFVSTPTEHLIAGVAGLAVVALGVYAAPANKQGATAAALDEALAQLATYRETEAKATARVAPGRVAPGGTT